MDIQKKDVTISKNVDPVESSVVVDSDAIVNDSKPDLLKVLHVDPHIKISKVDMLGGRMMVSGRVTYKILCLPENGTGVFSLSSGADFSHMIENSDFAEGMYCDVTADTDQIETQIINSRKLKIKSVLSITANASMPFSVSLPSEICGDNIETKTASFGGLRKVLQKRDMITINELLPLPAGKPNIGTLLKSDVSLRNKDIKVISGKVIAKGEVVVLNLYVPENGGNIVFCEHCLPFTEILDAEGVNEEHYCKVDIDMDDCDFSLSTDPDGDIRVIGANICMSVKINADEPLSETAICDVYSLTQDLDISYDSHKFSLPVCNATSSHTLRESLSVSDNISSVYNITAKPYVSSSSVYDNTVVTEGYIDACVLYISSDEDAPVASKNFEIPFKVETAADGATEGCTASCSTDVNHISYNIASSGEVDVRIVLCCNNYVCKTGSTDIIDKIDVRERQEQDSSSIVIYFVQKGDCLWDIAKRYHTKIDYIKELNGESCENLTEGTQLLIPRG